MSDRIEPFPVNPNAPLFSGIEPRKNEKASAVDWTALKALGVAKAIRGDATTLSDGATLLSSIVVFIRRFIVLCDAATVAVALWIIHTHTFGAADETPYLQITSPVKQCGKSRLLELLDLLVAKAWLTGRVTPAVLLRKTHAETPTLLLDESDAAFKSDKEYAETLRGLLNTGHRRSGTQSLCVPSGKEWKVETLRTFCPKAIAGIGGLPDTVADRSIVIRLERKTQGDRVERSRRRIVAPQAAPIREAIEAWAGANVDALRDARPELPEELDDRAQDGWEPLLAIADQMGGEWPTQARKAAVQLSGSREQEDDSLAIQLLLDCGRVFEARGVDRIASADLAAELGKLEESPWGPERGQPFDARRLARLLRPFGIKPKMARFENETKRGYERTAFADSWNRYAPSSLASERNDRNNASTTGFLDNSETVTDATPLRSENGEEPR